MMLTARKNAGAGCRMESIGRFFLDNVGIPHGYCFAWNPTLLWLMVTSNAAVALAYFSIPFTLLRFLRLQRELPFSWIFVLFGAFIFFCGLTHLIDILNIFEPAYRLGTIVMVLTALVSVATAATLIPLVSTASKFLDQGKLQGQQLLSANAALQETSAALAERNLALAASEQRFRLTIHGAPIGLAIVSTDGRWLEVNAALCAILEYPANELLSKTFQQITHPDDLDQDLKQARSLLEGQASSYRMQKRYFTKSGRVISVQLDVTLLRDSDGLPLHFISQIQDITARLKIEQALRNSEAEARVLGVLDGTLQACQSLDEIGPPAASACQSLYPGSSGVIYIRNASKTSLERCHGWGDTAVSEPVFAPDDCWALRRGRPVAVDFDEPNATVCQHMAHEHGPIHAVCLPLLAQGDIVGLLHLQWQKQAATPAAAGEQIANRLGQAIANLQLRASLRLQTIIDPLTSLHNRRHLEESLVRDLARAQRDGSSIAVLMIDVDHFKRYNDRYGHGLGDQVLRQVGAVLAGVCRSGDLAARYGGEEFTIVMADVEESTAMARAELLRQRMVETRVVTIGGASIPAVTISVGVAMYPRDGSTPTEVVEAADQALYAAKQQGRNRVVSHSSMPPAKT